MDPDPKVRPEPAELAAVPLFASLSPEQLEVISGRTSVHRFDAGRRLIGQGTPGYSFFILQEGTASVASDGAEVAELVPGDFFGEMALLGEGDRTATVTAKSPVKLVVMQAHDFRVFTRDFPDVASRIRDAMAARFEQTGGAGTPSA